MGMGRVSKGLSKGEKQFFGCLSDLIMLPFTLFFGAIKALFFGGKKGRR